MAPLTVLYVDPDEADRAATTAALEDGADDVAVVARGSVEAAADVLDERTVDCVVTAYDLPDGDAFDVVARVRAAAPGVGVVLFTDADPVAIDTSGVEDHLLEYVPRDAPDAEDRLRALVRTTVEGHTQAAYPLPDDEPGRNGALESLGLDAEALDGPLDRVTELAARYFGVEVASVNVLDDRVQRVRTCHGADWPPGSREDSICTYTVLEDDGMTVADVEADPRFADNEVLRELGIRAYMGANVTTPAGHTVATLCVYDDEPREFSADEAAYLQLLADVVADLLVLHADGEVAPSGAVPG